MEITTLIYLLLIAVINLETSKSQSNVCYCPPHSGTFCGHYLMKNVSRSTFCEKNRIYNCVYQEPEEEATRIKDCVKGEYCLDNQVQEEEGKWIYGATCEPEGEELDSKRDEAETTTVAAAHTTTTKKKKKKKSSKKSHKEYSVVDVNDVKLLEGTNDHNSSNSNAEASNGDKPMKVALTEYTTQSPVFTSSSDDQRRQTSDTDKRLKETSGPINENSNTQSIGESQSETEQQQQQQKPQQSQQPQQDPSDSGQFQQPSQSDDTQSIYGPQQREPTNSEEERNGYENGVQSNPQPESSDNQENQYVIITTTDTYDSQNSGDSRQDQSEPQLIAI